MAGDLMLLCAPIPSKWLNHHRGVPCETFPAGRNVDAGKTLMIDPPTLFDR